VTSLTADAALCDEVNVGGTRHALELASEARATGRLRKLVHLSTAFVTGARSGGVSSEDELPAAPAHFNHYERSKYEAEALVRAATMAGLPATIVRPSMVVGDTATGWTRNFNVIYPLVRLLANGDVTSLPADAGARLHLAPIDYVVDVVVAALDADWSAGRTFHATGLEPPTVADLLACDAFFPGGGPRPALRDPAGFDPASAGARERELLESVSFCLPYFRSGLALDVTNVSRLVAPPATDGAYLRRLGEFAAAAGYLGPRGTE
jgi:nucleoside-diphosphate-sugar epimerase